MNNVMKYLGVVLMLIGTIVLVLSYFLNWTNINSINVGALAAMILGLVLYIVLNKKAYE